MPISDADLLRGWSQGDADAGEALFDRYFESLCRFFRNKTDDDIGDLVHQVFLACLERAREVEPQHSFRAYMFAVARNTLYAQLKRRGFREVLADDAAVGGVRDPRTSLSARMVQDQRIQILLDALRKLPLELQIVIELYFWERLSAAELGRVIDLPEGTVRTRLRRAKELLRAQLESAGASQHASEEAFEDWARSVRDAVFPGEAAVSGR